MIVKSAMPAAIQKAISIAGSLLWVCESVRIGRDDDLNAGGDRFQLQCDVGRGPDHRDQGYQNGKAGALAVAGRNQVGDGGDPVHMADPDQFAQQEPPEDENQCQAKVDGANSSPLRTAEPTAP